VKKVEQKLLGNLDADVSFSKIHVRPFNTIIIRDLVIIDKAPQIPSEAAMEHFREEFGPDYVYEPYDTLIRAGYIQANLSLKGAIFQKRGVLINNVIVKNGRVNLVVEEEGRLTNLQRMFGMQKSDGEMKPETDKEVFAIKKARLSNMIYSMQIIREKHPHYKNGINWCDLYVYDINAEASDVMMRCGIMSGTLNNLSFKEKSGFEAYKLSGNTAVGRGQALIENIKLNASGTDVNLKYFSMSFRKPKDFQDFNAKIMLDGKILPSRLNSKTVGYFVPAMSNMNLVLDVDGEIHGTVDSFNLNDVNVSAEGYKFNTVVSGNVSGITADKELTLDLYVNDCKTDTKGVMGLISGLTGKAMKLQSGVPDVNGTMNAHVRGPLDKLCVLADIGTDAGKVFADVDLTDLTKKNKKLRIDGKIKTDNLDVSKFIKSDLIHECSLDTKLHAYLRGADGPQATIDTLVISRLNVNNYDYTRILATGDLSKSNFNGRVISQDPNFNFLFQGILTFSPKTQNAVYQFYANVGHADLHALNFDKRENSTVRFVTNANFNKTGNGVLLGNISVRDINLTNENEKHNLGDVLVTSRSADGEYRINFKSTFANAAFGGTAPVTAFVKDLIGNTAKKELPALFKDSSYTSDNQMYNLVFECVDTKDITAFFKPGLYIDNNTRMNVILDKNGELNATLTSHRLALREKYIKDMTLKIDNKEDRLRGTLTCDDLNISAVQFINNTITLLANDNHLGGGIVCEGDNNSSTVGEIYATADLTRDRDGLGIAAQMLPSSFTFNESNWSIMPASATIKNGDIKIEYLHFSSGDQDIAIDGGISKNHADTLSVNLERFNIGIASAFLKEGYNLKGDVTGSAQILSYADKNKKGFIVDMLSEGTSFADTDLGDVEIASNWDDDFNRFNVLVDNDRSLALKGYYTPSMKDTDINLHLSDFELSVAKPFLQGLFSDISGKLSGDIVLTGPIDNLTIRSTDGHIDNANVVLDFTKVPYVIDGPFHLDEYGLYFDSVSLKDRRNGTGIINGKLTYDHFKDIGVNLLVKANNAELINIPEKDANGFYGNVFGNGTIAIEGPLTELSLDIEATTSGGDFHIPTSATGKNSGTDLLTFKEDLSHVVLDPYEEMMNSLNVKTKTKTDLIVRLKAHATQDVEAHLELDKGGNNGLTCRGNGTLDIDVRPSRSVFNLKGDYTLANGTFLFNVMNLAKREFTITEGSSIKFNGAIKNSDLDIEAVYKTKASLARLISDTTSVNTRRLVECGIQITDKLSNPTLGFTIDVPDLEPSIKSKVENALSTEDKVQKQFIALLASNDFLPDEQSGVYDQSSTGLIASSVANVFSNQLNNILQKLNIPLDFDMRYQQNQKGNDVFDVAVSTQLFNNRIIVNGNIGNRQYNTGNSNSDVVGDLDIEIKLDKPGVFRMSLFSHSADQYTNYLDNSQRNGIGFTFQQEFNRFIEMMRYTFASKEKKEEYKILEAERAAAEPHKVMRVDENGNLVTVE